MKTEPNKEDWPPMWLLWMCDSIVGVVVAVIAVSVGLVNLAKLVFSKVRRAVR